MIKELRAALKAAEADRSRLLRELEALKAAILEAGWHVGDLGDGRFKIYKGKVRPL